MASFASLLAEVRACTICAPHLPDGVRPVLQMHPQARALIAGQAPGRKVHESGVPFDDASGDRLREWLGVTREVFYDPEQIAILPMGFCFPGTGRSGDLPPRPECAQVAACSLARRDFSAPPQSEKQPLPPPQQVVGRRSTASTSDTSVTGTCAISRANNRMQRSAPRAAAGAGR